MGRKIEFTLEQAEKSEMSDAPSVFNPQSARRALLRAIQEAFAKAPSVEEGDRPITARMRAALDIDMPSECFIASPAHPDGAYVPAWLVELAAQEIFGDRWSSDVLEASVVRDGHETIRDERNGRITVHRVVASARVAVEVRSPGGRTQRHVAVGVATYDVPMGSNEQQVLYRVAIKGAVTDARRTALAQFGRIFSFRCADTDHMIFHIPNERALAQEQDYPREQGQEESHSTPPKTVSRRIRAKRDEYNVFDENGAILAKFPRNLEGAMKALEAIGEILSGCDSPNSFGSARSANSSTIARIESEHGNVLAEAISSLKQKMENATLQGAEPTPSRDKQKWLGDKNSSEPQTEQAELVQQKTRIDSVANNTISAEDRLNEILAALERATTPEQVQFIVDEAISRPLRLPAKAILRISEVAAHKRQSLKHPHP